MKEQKSSRQQGFLLASFFEATSDEEIMQEVQAIADNLQLTNKFIFLFENKETPTKKILTYNAIPEKGKRFNPRLFTMRVHRKKQTNTLYTINALNLAIAKEHDGKTGRNLKLDWENYRESILLSVNRELEVQPIQVVQIFKIEEEPEVPKAEPVQE
jgi:hypothetical protein